MYKLSSGNKLCVFWFDNNLSSPHCRVYLLVFGVLCISFIIFILSLFRLTFLTLRLLCSSWTLRSIFPFIYVKVKSSLKVVDMKHIFAEVYKTCTKFWIEALLILYPPLLLPSFRFQYYYCGAVAKRTFGTFIYIIIQRSTVQVMFG